ncbi:hypothetical protein QFW77_08300 [Luteimonas sp. RD2P54]|uniref:Spore protein YkvP/CgeB glycosyl transferase-like domain-containing protein n=1 Tax=Luteimonas endophytica TaxID=3042023 RepID=A0ABT6J834_9GAMM|nr:hypothetical protein [Luteimonas endophytica]MDH5822989.1 hypothetical protein [Luteimonas endophytica]
MVEPGLTTRAAAAIARRIVRVGDAISASRMSPVDPRHLRPATDLRVAVVCDEFTGLGLAPECEATFLSPKIWRLQVQKTRPQLLFVESCWSGCAGQWRGLVTGGGEVVTRLVRFCRHAGIPTVFWAKEDPVHLDDFLATAKLFDWVFTTDAGSISRYRRELRHDRLGVMTFPVQPRLHNPLSSSPRERASFFAGAWYGNFPRRCAEFSELAEGLMDAGPFHVYRRPGPPEIGDYPDRFADALYPAVDYARIGDIYRRYSIGLSINTVTDSPTMFARRAVEMLACGTTVYSNPCRALGEFFPGLVEQFSRRERIAEKARREYSEPASMSRRLTRALGVRAAVGRHSWSARLAMLIGRIAGRDELRQPEVAMVARVADAGEMARLAAFLESQRGVCGEAVAWVADGVEPCRGVRRLTADQLSAPLSELLGGDTLLGYWSPMDWYGPHYLLDLCLAAGSYAGNAVGKGAYYHWDGAALEQQGTEAEYTHCGPIPLRRSLARARVWPGNSTLQSIGLAEQGGHATDAYVSIDAFSYAQGGSGASMPAFMAAEYPSTRADVCPSNWSKA